MRRLGVPIAIAAALVLLEATMVGVIWAKDQGRAMARNGTAMSLGGWEPQPMMKRDVFGVQKEIVVQRQSEQTNYAASAHRWESGTGQNYILAPKVDKNLLLVPSEEKLKTTGLGSLSTRFVDGVEGMEASSREDTSNASMTHERWEKSANYLPMNEADVMEDVWAADSRTLKHGIAKSFYEAQYPAQAGRSATRSFSKASVESGGEVVVSITAAGYGTFGSVVETLPAGFGYMSSSLLDSAVIVRDRTITFVLVGDSDFTYTVTASSEPGLYSFHGVLQDFHQVNVQVGGSASISVGAPTPSIRITTGTDPLVRIGEPIPITITFSEPVVGFTLSDIAVSNSTASNFSGNGADYTFNVTPNAIGEVTLDIASNVAMNNNGIENREAIQLSLGIPYDDDGDGGITKSEAITAVIDYFTGRLTKQHAIDAVILYFSGASGASPTPRSILVSLYNATDGPNWANNTNWLTDAPLGEWYGVTTNDQGEVTYLILMDNQLNGVIPAELGGLTTLTALWLNDNRLRGDIPAELSNLSNLTTLLLGYNQLSGDIPQELGNLSNLKTLALSYNQLSGDIPEELGDLSNLIDLLLNDNQLSGAIPAELGTLANLEDMWLSYNQLSGQIPLGLDNLGNLKRLLLNDNRLSGEIPTELTNLSKLTSLWLHNNRLVGKVPGELSTLTNLQGLDLSGNQLTGEIPASLGRLGDLIQLNLSINRLTGEIPSELGNLGNLLTLWLYGNQLNGEIPSELSNLSNLQSLHLNYNQLSGEIPTDLGQLSNLTSLWLHGNLLTGCIPDALGNVESTNFGNLPFCSESDGTKLTLTVAAIPTTIPDYNRSEWRHWVDQDGDCQNTRQEVLIAESRTQVSFRTERQCNVASGDWFGAFTGTVVQDPGNLDIDHMVPLKNAHDSGGWAWTVDRKREYANYLLDADHLIAVTARANRSKGARGPHEWKPSATTYWCTYATDWAEVKERWDLTLTQPEADAVQEMLSMCDDPPEVEVIQQG